MKYVIAPDSFKESMTAGDAAAAMEEGIRSVDPAAECVIIPMSDGGEGFAHAVAAAWGAEWIELDSVDALGRPIRAGYGLSGHEAVVDIASSAGLEQIAPRDRDVARSSSAGLGILVRDAIARGARRVVIGLGGSATNDAGAGMLVALGARLLDARGRQLAGTLGELGRVASVDLSGLPRELRSAGFLVASDVTNPLTGPRGATAVFGPQKGVPLDAVAEYDAALGRFALLVGSRQLAERPGAGAAGGVGFALTAVLNAEIRPGIDVVSGLTDLPQAMSGADLVLTGEGSVDAQTLDGKAPAGIARIAARAGVSVLLFAGRLGRGSEALLEHGVTELHQIVDEDVPLSDALANGFANLREATAEAVRRHLAK